MFTLSVQFRRYSARNTGETTARVQTRDGGGRRNREVTVCHVCFASEVMDFDSGLHKKCESGLHKRCDSGITQIP